MMRLNVSGGAPLECLVSYCMNPTDTASSSRNQLRDALPPAEILHFRVWKLQNKTNLIKLAMYSDRSD